MSKKCFLLIGLDKMYSKMIKKRQNGPIALVFWIVFRSELTKAAQKSSIDVFSNNLRNLLLTAPVKGYSILGIDPGYKNGCKCAIISQTGTFIMQFTSITCTGIYCALVDGGRSELILQIYTLTTPSPSKIDMMIDEWRNTGLFSTLPTLTTIKLFLPVLNSLSHDCVLLHFCKNVSYMMFRR